MPLVPETAVHGGFSLSDKHFISEITDFRNSPQPNAGSGAQTGGFAAWALRAEIFHLQILYYVQKKRMDSSSAIRLFFYLNNFFFFFSAGILRLTVYCADVQTQSLVYGQAANEQMYTKELCKNNLPFCAEQIFRHKAEE